jgi:diadenosine tetraphosphate (Ap4A) HIT family hydrolase
MTCVICERIAVAARDGDPYLVAELRTGWVMLAENQFYEGTTEFVSKVCAAELHELPPGIRNEYLREMAAVAEAVFRAFEPAKLNYELLGNSVPHLHWRLFPRHAGDEMGDRPVWENPLFQRTLSSGEAEPLPLRREELKARITAHLRDATSRSAPPPGLLPSTSSAVAAPPRVTKPAPAPRPTRFRRR